MSTFTIEINGSKAEFRRHIPFDQYANICHNVSREVVSDAGYRPWMLEATFWRYVFKYYCLTPEYQNLSNDEIMEIISQVPEKCLYNDVTESILGLTYEVCNLRADVNSAIMDLREERIAKTKGSWDILADTITVALNAFIQNDPGSISDLIGEMKGLLNSTQEQKE